MARMTIKQMQERLKSAETELAELKKTNTHKVGADLTVALANSVLLKKEVSTLKIRNNKLQAIMKEVWDVIQAVVALQNSNGEFSIWKVRAIFKELKELITVCLRNKKDFENKVGETKSVQPLREQYLARLDLK